MRRVYTLVLTASLALACWGTLALGAPVRDASWVEGRVREWQPTERERRWEKIGWARDIREAIRLGKQHKRPVFMFTLDGRMNVGRC